MLDQEFPGSKSTTFGTMLSILNSQINSEQNHGTHLDEDETNLSLSSGKFEPESPSSLPRLLLRRPSRDVVSRMASSRPSSHPEGAGAHQQSVYSHRSVSTLYPQNNISGVTHQVVIKSYSDREPTPRDIVQLVNGAQHNSYSSVPINGQRVPKQDSWKQQILRPALRNQQLHMTGELYQRRQDHQSVNGPKNGKP
jgi:hypothetical protein